MKSVKKLLNIHVSITQGILILTLVFFLLGVLFYKSFIAGDIGPTVEPIISYPTPVPSLENMIEDECPTGYYQYGVPLGCVPNSYQCDPKTQPCPR